METCVGSFGPVGLAQLARLIPAGTLYGALHDARRRWPKDLWLEDSDGTRLTRDRLVLGAEVLGGRLAAIGQAGERIGLMLPNVAGVAVVFFAMQAAGLVPALMNFSVGARGLTAAVGLVDIRTVITSRRFIEAGNLTDELAALQQVARVIFVEDLRSGLSMLDKLKGLVKAKWPVLSRRWRKAGVHDEAVVLFTSGTEGLPKGVSLSHHNILANLGQIRARVFFDARDVLFNALPTFHCFGLTAGLFLPLYCGFRAFFYPSPLHFRQIPPLVRASGTTALVASDTFLGHWGRAAEPQDFAGLRLLVCGAERVQPQTRAFIGEKFGKEILEGYGVTETAPVMAVNTPEDNREGTVGALMIGMEARVEPIEGITDAGRLFVRGPNVMRGHYLAGAPGVLVPPPDGWHDTGDIVHMDADGVITIRGRARRFAKIAGETVSLGAVEGLVARAYPGFSHAVIAVPDPRKGEALVLVSDCPHLALDGLLAKARADGISEFQVPKRLRRIEQLPVLSTGKINYVAVRAIVEAEPA